VLAVIAVAPTARATFPRANGRLVFDRRAPGDTYEVYSMNPDGSGLVNLTNEPANDRDPSVSPDGSKIAFRTDRDGNDEIYIMNFDGRDPTRFTNDPGLDSAPAWSSDGSAIVWTRASGGPPFIHIMNVDGTNDHVVGIGGFPQFSPDGTKIAVTRRVDPADPDSLAVFVMNADGSHLRQVTPNDIHGALQDWSPDGNRLVFSSAVCDACAESDLYTIKANGKDLRRLTYYVGTGVNAHEPAWSPNGKQIVFTHWDDQTFTTADLFVVNIDGTGIQNLTNTSLVEREADWQPLAGD